MTTQPIHSDLCNHGLECFMGSVYINGLFYDIYVYEAFPSQTSICIRYGSYDEDYLPAGTLKYFLMTVADEDCSTPSIYKEVLNLLLSHGTFSYKL